MISQHDHEHKPEEEDDDDDEEEESSHNSERKNYKKDSDIMAILRYVHPFSFIGKMAFYIEDFILPHLVELDDDIVILTDKLYNLFSVLVVHGAYQYCSWMYFFHIVMVLGILKRIMLTRMEKIRYGKVKEQHSNRQNCCTDQPFKDPVYATANNAKSVTFGRDKMKEFCERDLRPSFEWLNRIILTMWLKYRAYLKFKFLHHLWPKVKERLQDTPLNNLEILDFNIGDKPFRVISIESMRHGDEDLIIDVEIAYDGNANITITYSQASLNVSIPVTLQKFCVSNVKVRIVLKKMFDEIPFLGGIQLFFLESPIIDWQTADAARVVDLPGLDSLLKGAIENQIIRRFVHPNKLTIPIKVDPKLAKRLTKLQLPVRELEDWEVAMPRPVGVVRVTVLRAEGLRATDFSFQHYKTSDNVNPFNPKKFSLPELLPKKSSADPYVQVSIGRATHRSAALANSLNPEWNFICEFPIEYYHKAVVKINIFDENLGIAGIGRDDNLGKITEKVSRIKENGRIEGWYNCQIYQGRAFLKFEWIPLSTKKPQFPRPVDLKSRDKDKVERHNIMSGVVCVLVGTLHCSEIIRPTCILEMLEGNELSKGTTLDAMSNCMSWTFDEGKVFRMKNLNELNSHLLIKIYDNKSWKWIGEQRFKVRRLLEKDMNKYFRFPNPYTNLKPVALSLTSKILFDKVHHHPAGKKE